VWSVNFGKFRDSELGQSLAKAKAEWIISLFQEGFPETKEVTFSLFD